MAIEKLYHAPDPGTSSLQGPFRGDVVEQLRIRMKATQEKLEESEAALNRCREYSARDIEIISRQRAKIIELEDLVQKQKATISNQSKAIADPKTMRVRQPAIPMPIFPLTPTQQGSCVRSPGSSTPSSVRSPYPSSVFDLPPPTFDMPISIPQGKSTSLAEISKMSPNSRSNLSKSNCSLCPSLNTKTAIVVISDRLQSLFARTQLFAHTYTNFPSIHLDSQLNPKVKEYVMSISDKLHASTLLGNPCTRFCVVTKAINFYLVHDILQLTVVKGFDAHMNLEVKQMQDFLTQDTPPAVRHPLLIAMAHRIHAMVKKPEFSEFNNNITIAQMEILWSLIGPLTHDPLNQHHVAWLELQDIVTEARALAIDLYSLPLEYSFNFPAVNEMFEPSTMVNCDQFIGGNPQTLKDNSFIRLGVTPTIRIRDNSTTPADVRLVGFAKVLLRPPPRRYTQLVSQISPDK